MAVLTPVAKMQFLDATGAPLVGGLLYTYAAGTTTPQATYTDSTGAQANTNPVVLDARGEANIWLGAATYKFKLASSDNTELWTVDNISAPTSALSPVLSGNVTIDSNSAGPALKITQTGTGPVLRVQDSIDPDATPFIIDSTGQVGIGTQAPLTALDVNDGVIQLSSSGTSRTTISADASNSTFAAPGSRGIILNANSANLLYGTSSGYVGIKNASPTVELDVTGAFKTSGAITGGTSIAAGTTLASGTTLTAGSSLTVTTSASIGTTLSVDTVQEKTASAGVSVSNTLKVDTINGKTSANTITLAGIAIASSQIPAANRLITASAVQSTASGTEITFSNIPSWVKRISVNLNGVSASGTDSLLIQLGTSGGFASTTYDSVSLGIGAGGTPGAASSTSGLIIQLASATYTATGVYTINLMDSTNRIYVGAGEVYLSTLAIASSAGKATLNATLTQLKLVLSGANTFDAGSVNIFYE